ncbi:MAG: hypothetical protein WCK02_00180 [Bacteroidota bacterium]
MNNTTANWSEITNKIFPAGIPEKHEWTDISEIVKTLNIIGTYPNSNFLFYPTGGESNIKGAMVSAEEGCIEIDTSLNAKNKSVDLLKPVRLIFHSFENNDTLSYFRIETDEIQPTDLYEKDDDNGDENDDIPYYEEVCELSACNYIHIDYLKENWYRGEKLPKTARTVARHFKGSFVIFCEASKFAKLKQTFDITFSILSDEEFYEFIKSKTVPATL